MAVAITAMLRDAHTLRHAPSAVTAAGAIASLFPTLDKQALADFFESALGGFAVAGAQASALSRLPRVKALDAELSPDEYGLGTNDQVLFAPFNDAMQRLGIKAPVASALRSAQWAVVPAELKARAQFSAGVESAAFLQEVSNHIMDRLAGRENDPDEFIFQMRQVADQVGLPLAAGDGLGMPSPITDIRSLPRLRLVYETQNAMAAEYSRRKADLDPEALDLYPAYAFERVESRREPRPAAFWQARWREAGSIAGWIGAAQEPMVALKTSPLWLALGSLGPFGNPHPPFEWGSGMGTIDVSHDAAVALGLLSVGERMRVSTDPAFNQDLSASVSDLNPELRTMLKGWFGDKVQETDGRLTWTK